MNTDNTNAVRAITDSEIQAWLEFFAAENPASNRKETPAWVKEERKYNRVVIEVNGRGYKRAFMEITRRYSEKTNKTRITTRLLTYDGKTRAVNVKKSLSKVATGDVTWRHTMSVESTNISATWRNDRFMTKHESDAWDSAVQTVKTHNLWGRNDLADYVKAQTENAPKFETFETAL